MSYRVLRGLPYPRFYKHQFVSYILICGISFLIKGACLREKTAHVFIDFLYFNFS